MSRRFLAAFVAALLALAWAIPAPASQTPPPRKAKKVWTNEDLEALRPGGITILKPSPASATAGAAASEEAAAKEEKEGEEKKKGPTPLEKIQKRLAPLRVELASVESQLQSLRQARASGSTTGEGLDISKAPGGLNTENQITQLQNRRTELLRQISDIEDEARRLGIPPGALR